MKIKIINKSKHVLPAYATLGASGMDLYANISEPVILKPLERYLVPTGIFIQIPSGYEGQIRARSGIAIKKGITLINGVGTIDSDYTGEIKLGIINLSNENFEIKDGERIAQLVIAQYTQIQWLEVETLEETARGENGFGSTGQNNPTKTFRSPIGQANSFGNVHFSDDTESTLELFTNEDSSYTIKWDISELEETEHIIVYVNEGTRIINGYDGVYEIPREAIDFLIEEGFDVKHFIDIN